MSSVTLQAVPKFPVACHVNDSKTPGEAPCGPRTKTKEVLALTKRAHALHKQVQALHKQVQALHKQVRALHKQARALHKQ
eukprot:gene9943-biopygen2213